MGLFGGRINEDAFIDEKQKAIESALGPMEKYVVHSVIPFAMGGAVDLYPFRRHIPGMLYVTQELFNANKKERPKKSRQGWYELAAAYRDESAPTGKVPASLEEMEQAFETQDGPTGAAKPSESALLARSLLTPMARYAEIAVLNPGETAEIPGEEEGSPNDCILLDRLECAPMSAGGTPFFLMLVIQIHRGELALARAQGSGVLIQRLKEMGYYPYSDMDRPPVA